MKGTLTDIRDIYFKVTFITKERKCIIPFYNPFLLCCGNEHTHT